MNDTANSGLSAASTDGFETMCGTPSTASTTNQSAQIGPKNLPTSPVPKRCAANSTVSTTSVTGTT